MSKDVILTKQAKAEKAAYMREYRRKNKGKDKEIQARYWERRALLNARTKKENEK